MRFCQDPEEIIMQTVNAYYNFISQLIAIETPAHCHFRIFVAEVPTRIRDRGLVNLSPVNHSAFALRFHIHPLNIPHTLLTYDRWVLARPQPTILSMLISSHLAFFMGNFALSFVTKEPFQQSRPRTRSDILSTHVAQCVFPTKRLHQHRPRR